MKDELLERLVSAVEMQGKILQNQQSLLDKQNTKSAYTTTSGSYTELHGDGSLFGNESLERDVITAHVRPEGIASRLPILPTVIEDPRFALLTGVTGDVGNEPANPCDPAPNGFLKACTISAQFGRVTRDTQDIDITKVMLQRNRGDFTDLVLRGRLLGLTNLPPSGMTENDILNVVTKSEMVQVGVRLERKLNTLMWQGSPANNNAGGGYAEFPGLDAQIATGHVDFSSNTACGAVDSDVKNFAYNEVGGTGLDIVEYLSSMEFYLRNNARKMGLDPATWVVVMRPELWFELSAVWPCSYLTNRCGDSSGNQVAVINDNVNVNMRDGMRNSMSIIINGNTYEVIVDDGIFEHNNVNNGSVAAGQYASSIYFVPLTITGGFPVVYREHLDYRAATSDISMLRDNPTFWTDDGMYLWVFDQNRGCYRLGATTEQRVILRTPHLAGRIDSVLYTPLQHLRDSDPDSPYWVDGGVSMRSDNQTRYATWL